MRQIMHHMDNKNMVNSLTKLARNSLNLALRLSDEECADALIKSYQIKQECNATKIELDQLYCDIGESLVEATYYLKTYFAEIDEKFIES